MTQWNRVLTVALAATTLSTLASAQIDYWSRPADWNRVDDTPAGQAKAYKLVQQAMALVQKAGMNLQRALPVYGGHANRAESICRFALLDLRSTLEYRNPSASGRAPTRPVPTDFRERLSKIPEVADKSKREYQRELVNISDTQVNEAGGFLLEARECLANIHKSYDGHLTDSKKWIDLAIGEVERSVGRIRWPGQSNWRQGNGISGWDDWR